MEHHIGIAERKVHGVVFRSAKPFEARGGVAHGFSTRLGGVSLGIWASMNLGTTRGDDPEHVRENYRRFLAAIGASGGQLAMSHQVHGAHIRTVRPGDCNADPYAPQDYEADGLITDAPGVALAVFSADCLPILFYDPVRRVVCAVHAGWRGTAAGIAPRAVEKMTADYGCHPKNILAAIGPGISHCHFETHADVPDALRRVLPEGAEDYLLDHGNGKYHVDLKGVNAALLRRAGVPGENITIDLDCTVCLPEKYWSHRVTAGARGSQAAVIQLL